MRVLLDHNLDRRLKKHLLRHEVKTTFEMGWQSLSNGKLLAYAIKEFDVFLTCDANIKHQHNISQYNIGIVTIRASDNRLITHAQMINEIEEAITKVERGELREVFHPHFSKI
jgi:predicted nuclease of predicted toxin-antitoxin system